MTSTPSQPKAPTIIATSQQSRFALDCLDAPESKEIDLKDVTISIDGKEVLDHAHLKIKEGGRYILVGRNGSGKSTLLRAMADGLIPGIPWNLRILLLGQTIITSDVYDDSLAVSIEGKEEEVSVLQHVVQSDRRREKLLRELNLLEKPLESQDTLAALRAYRQFKLEKARLRLLELKLVASKRSGARGAKARKALLDGEQALKDSEAALENVDEDAAKGDGVEEELRGAVEALEEIRMALEAMDSNNTESLSRRVLKGLGFSEDMISSPFSKLSGGWRTRCFLASALVQKTDILCLDEPTNFLDLPAVIWLQSYLVHTLSKQTSLLLVTHDRDFADGVGEDLIMIRTAAGLEKKLELYKGTLSSWEREKRLKILYLTRMQEALDKKKAHMVGSVQENVKAAKKTGDDKKLKQAAAKQKKIDDRLGMERNEKGHRFKLNRDAVGYFTTSRQAIEIPELEPTVVISFPSTMEKSKLTGSLVSLENVDVRYKGAKEDTLKGINLVVHPGDRIGICGVNGSGKSTLIRVLTSSLPASKGTVTRHPRAKVGYYSQHAVESVTRAGLSDPSLTSHAFLSAAAQAAGLNLGEQELRSCLANLGLKGRLVTDVPVRNLSGGQKVRLALAKIVVADPDLLVLDEVTTHLDADTIVGLAEALVKWEGAVVLVSHDRWIIRYVIEGERDEAGEEEEDAGVTVFRLRGGQLMKLDGGMREYEDLMLKKVQKAGLG
ncbi:P-loop containing nucleoside triphosphate hydrolase protein [Atractiella rhizophila]|nr:P-loop containing nucleoside triphosphate hydrolase protein [Atractiella rhizophila]